MPESTRLTDTFRWSRLLAGDAEHTPNSLFLEILDWMLAPLLLLWPISIAVTNHYAHQIANQPFDVALTESVQTVSRFIESSVWPLPQHLPHAVQLTLTGNGLDSRYYRINVAPPQVTEYAPPMSTEFPAESVIERTRSPSAGSALGSGSPTSPLLEMGTANIPLPDGIVATKAKTVLLRDDAIAGAAVRVAYRAVRVPGGPVVLVQVAETRNEREALVTRIIRGVLLPQFALIPLVAILSYLGLTRGLQPLRRLREKIIGRRPGDLSPLATNQAPEEVRPLLTALNDMMLRLESNLQAQQRFIADAAHQLRTPLTGLKMQADLAVGEEDPRRLQHSMRLIADSTDRAAHLTNQLLTLARTESSHDKLHRFEPVDFRALARAVTIEWAERALAKDIDLAFDCGDWPHMSEGAPLLLRELLSNLIDNAVKYTPRGGRVTVRLRSTEFVLLEVEDSGIGIPADERAKVFERFYRVLGSEESGSGLGLPIVQEIADLHRARVELLDGDSGGTLFRVSFIRRGGAVAPMDLRPE